MPDKITGGLWRNAIKGGKYLVQRRDGSIPEWPYFVLGARDPAAAFALREYADESERQGRDARYVADVRQLADEFECELLAAGTGDPDAVPHRVDDPGVVRLMERHSRGA